VRRTKRVLHETEIVGRRIEQGPTTFTFGWIDEDPQPEPRETELAWWRRLLQALRDRPSLQDLEQASADEETPMIA
jgi:hypothetical protein